MTANQPEPRLLVMIEPRCFPVGLQVARFAPGSKGSAMHVISPVTAITCCRWIYSMLSIRMAGVTFDITVSALKLEFGIPVMIEPHLLPERLCMAVVAACAKAAFVDIICPVATNTGCGQFFRVQRRFVASGTFGNAVGFSQRKVGVPLMVKTDDFPARLGMAVFTFFPELTLVHIIFPVTARTGPRRFVVKRRTPVAVTAAHRTMACQQWKGGFRMVERTPLPACRGVATVTGDTQLSLVHIVVQVAGHAVLRRLSEFFAFYMASAALDFGVKAKQDIVGERMIELRCVQSDNIRVPALVLSVTVATGSPSVHPSMKAGVHGHVPANFLVATQAQIGLLLFPEWNVTLATIGFNISMASDDFAGHDQGLQIPRGNRTRTDHK